MAHADHDIKAHVRTYMMVFGALLVLTVVTVAVSYLHMPILPAVTVALIIATFKASLVAMFFMHLKGDHIIGTRPDHWSAGAEAPTAPPHSPQPH